VNAELLLSASQDHSILLWNIRYASCIANFSGVGGHRDQVLTIDFSSDGSHFVSGGMDHCIKIWSLNVEELLEKVEVNNNAVIDSKRSETVRIHHPKFMTRDIHSNYVDTVKYFGSSILSKSCQNEITYWKYNENAKLKETGAYKLFTFDFHDCGIWFIRMELNLQKTQMAVGNESGKIFLFDLDTDVPINNFSTLSHEKCISCVRQIAFSRSGNILVAVCDDGTIWRWDRKEKMEEV
jgi:polycomb protein EED